MEMLDSALEEGFTIDRAAAFAGLTTAAVRNCHRRGLVREPGCDESGCRRY
ncbi:hypothetical protein ACQP1O_18940 [Nocardia sp. CA-151230]|uniref:hypothetical protein n=1 Tax=Nocardia sp. CA-151230 TaxID=3239982 RepID=UPI003D901D57